MLTRPISRARLLAGAVAAGCLLALAPVPAASAADAFHAGVAIATPGSASSPDVPAQVVAIARAEFAKGIREVPRGSDNSAEIARYRGALVPRARRPAAWCAYFASWVTRQAGAPIGRHGAGIASSAGIASWAQRTGRWTHKPRPGEIAVFRGHTGIVVAVHGARMTTIDGNWSDRVSQVARRRGDALGFARVAR